jgi:chromosome segregation ATPase
LLAEIDRLRQERPPAAPATGHHITALKAEIARLTAALRHAQDENTRLTEALRHAQDENARLARELKAALEGQPKAERRRITPRMPQATFNLIMKALHPDTRDMTNVQKFDDACKALNLWWSEGQNPGRPKQR